MNKKSTKEKARPVLFDILDNITYLKDDKWYEYEKAYVPFVINRILANNSETVLYADEMNKSSLNPKEQYYFYLHALPKKRRFFPSVKKEEKDDLTLIIANYYNINIKRAKEYMKMMNDEDINNIVKKTTIGTVT